MLQCYETFVKIYLVSSHAWGGQKGEGPRSACLIFINSGRSSGYPFKPSLRKQSSLSLLICPSSTPHPAPVTSHASTPSTRALMKNRMVNLSDTYQGQDRRRGTGCLSVRPPAVMRVQRGLNSTRHDASASVLHSLTPCFPFC